jgi:hypothetical protein
MVQHCLVSFLEKILKNERTPGLSPRLDQQTSLCKFPQPDWSEAELFNQGRDLGSFLHTSARIRAPPLLSSLMTSQPTLPVLPVTRIFIVNDLLG